MFLMRNRQIGTSGWESDTRRYSPESHTLDGSGQLAIRVRAEEGRTRWRGFLILSPFEPDYDFWYWMARVKQVSEVEERELENWKQQYIESKQVT